MRRLGARVQRVAAAMPASSPPAPPVDPSRPTPAHLGRAAHLQARYLAVGLAGLTDGELDEIVELQSPLTAPPIGAE